MANSISSTLEDAVASYATAGNSSVYSTTTTSSPWVKETVPSTLVFSVDGDEVEFTGKQLIRLKEMLSKFIEEEHPEDLL